MKYQRYPTSIKLHYAAKILPNAYFAAIPASTRHYWKSINAADFWQPDEKSTSDYDNTQLLKTILQNKRLLQHIRMLVYLLEVYRQLLQRFTITKTDFVEVRSIAKLCVTYAKQTTINLFKRLPFSYKQYCAWSKNSRCALSPLTLCRKKHPQQLTTAEQNNISQYCADKRFDNWPLSSIYCQLLRDEKLHCHLSTFYKYCRLLNLTRKPKRFKKTYTSLIAAAPLQMLHMDVSIFRTADNVKQYLYVIRDNYSKVILACKAAANYCSQIACDTLKAVLDKYGLIDKEGTLITDDGSENKGAVTEMLAQPGMLWKKIIAQIDIIQSNSMVEAANKIIKHRFLYKHSIANIDELIDKLPVFIEEYNNTPLASLSAYTPKEVLAGKIPDFKRFEKQFFIARKRRISANQNFTCTDTC